MTKIELDTPLIRHFHTIYTDDTNLYITSKQTLHKFSPNGKHLETVDSPLLEEACGMPVYFGKCVYFSADGANHIFGAGFGEMNIEVKFESVFN
jgi:hypothetical protein